jgi:hypothetical protein
MSNFFLRLGIFAQKEINTIDFSFTLEAKKDQKDIWFPLFGPIKLNHISIVDSPLTQSKEKSENMYGIFSSAQLKLII